MERIRWDEAEAVALFNLYFECGSTISPPEERIQLLSDILRDRARKNGITIDDKFRNLAGLKMQLACIHYIVTNGKSGMSNASKLFYRVFDLYQNDISRFNAILHDFYK